MFYEILIILKQFWFLKNHYYNRKIVLKFSKSVVLVANLKAIPTVACREYRASYLSFGLCAVCTQHANHHLPSFLMFQRGFGTYWSTCEMSIGKKRPRFFKSSTTTVPPLELRYQKHLLTRNWSRSRVKMGLSCLWWCSTFPFFLFHFYFPFWGIHKPGW